MVQRHEVDCHAEKFRCSAATQIFIFLPSSTPPPARPHPALIFLVPQVQFFVGVHINLLVVVSCFQFSFFHSLSSGVDLPGEEEKKSACHVLPCVEMEQNENSAKSGLDAEADAENAGNTRKRKRRGRRADKNQNMSPRLAPVGQEDEEDGSSAQNKTGDLAAGACGEELMTGGGRSARSSAVVESAAQVKRHSSGAKVMIRDVTDDEGGGHGDVSRGGGEGGGGGVQTKGRGVGVPAGGGGRVGNPGVSKADVNRTNQDTQAMIEAVKTHQPSAAMVAPSDVTRTQPPDRAQTRAAVTSSHRRSQYDAVAVPNTETFTSC